MSANLSANRYCVKRFSDSGADYSPAMAESRLRSEFGSRLHQARKHAGLTQTELSKKVGMSQSSYAEAEKTGSGSSYTAQIAAACGVRAEWLATGDGQMLPTTERPTIYVEGSIEAAMLVIAQAIGAADKYTLASVAGVWNNMLEQPSDAVNFARRIALLLEPPPNEEKVTSPTPHHSGAAEVVVYFTTEDGKDGTSNNTQGPKHQTGGRKQSGRAAR